MHRIFGEKPIKDSGLNAFWNDRDLGQGLLQLLESIARDKETSTTSFLVFKRFINGMPSVQNTKRRAAFSTHNDASAPKIRQVFCPPNPKELESIRRNTPSRPVFGTTSRGIEGSGHA